MYYFADIRIKPRFQVYESRYSMPLGRFKLFTEYLIRALIRDKMSDCLYDVSNSNENATNNTLDFLSFTGRICQVSIYEFMDIFKMSQAVNNFIVFRGYDQPKIFPVATGEAIIPKDISCLEINWD